MRSCNLGCAALTIIAMTAALLLVNCGKSSDSNAAETGDQDVLFDDAVMRIKRVEQDSVLLLASSLRWKSRNRNTGNQTFAEELVRGIAENGWKCPWPSSELRWNADVVTSGPARFEYSDENDHSALAQLVSKRLALIEEVVQDVYALENSRPQLRTSLEPYLSGYGERLQRLKNEQHSEHEIDVALCEYIQEKTNYGLYVRSWKKDLDEFSTGGPNWKWRTLDK